MGSAEELGYLIKTEVVFVVSHWTEVSNPSCVVMRPSGYDDPTEAITSHRLEFDRAVWAEMGSPETITVTIEPGDKLND